MKTSDGNHMNLQPKSVSWVWLLRMRIQWCSRRRCPRKGERAWDLCKPCKMFKISKLTSEASITEESEKAADLEVIQRPMKNQKSVFSATVFPRATSLRSPPMLVQKRGDQDSAGGRQEISPLTVIWMIWRIKNRRKKETGEETRQVMHSFIRN